jgi:hypothetical protein
MMMEPPTDSNTDQNCRQAEGGERRHGAERHGQRDGQ